ncbi:hypothetical protein M9H77_26812 [Catharanthus roseus]|uniref:Uncharacterized protein n=1 Tax=Catharanthus roseus TaxID=4058 RepID=A0ACC0ACW9_CATRO|nr:hypothetical protein M9H77_26812 [Catharanthus roseus]
MKAHPSLGKVPDRIKNMWYTEFGKWYRWDLMHECAIRDAWQKRVSLRYKNLMYEQEKIARPLHSRTFCSHHRVGPGRQQQLVIGSFDIFCGSPRVLYQEGEEVVKMHAAGTGQERGKELPRKCPHHSLDLGIHIQSFYNGISFRARQLINASAGGSTDNKTPQQEYDLIEQIAMNIYALGGQRAEPKTVAYDAPPPNPTTAKANLEDLMVKFMSAIDARKTIIKAVQRNKEAFIRNLEKHIGQLVKLLSERSPGTLSSNTAMNPREYVNAVSGRFDKERVKKERTRSRRLWSTSQIFRISQLLLTSVKGLTEHEAMMKLHETNEIRSSDRSLLWTVPSESKNDEEETKMDENRAETTKTEAIGKQAAPTADGRVHLTLAVNEKCPRHLFTKHKRPLARHYAYPS